MSDLHDMVREDVVSEFMNLDFFAEEHDVQIRGNRSLADPANENVIKCVLDADIHKVDAHFQGIGVQDCDCVLFARERDLPRGRAGDHLTIDGLFYTVVTWRLDMGVHEIALTGPTAY